MTDLLELLTARGFVQEQTPGLAERLRQGPITAYVGFDPRRTRCTSEASCRSWGMAWLQRLGKRPIALVGGGTGMVGDPSGKRPERPVMALEQIDRERAGPHACSFSGSSTFEGANAARLRNNADWLRRPSA